MKVKWTVEGAGCSQAGCGMKGFILEISDEDITDLSREERNIYIDEVVQEEFERSVCPTWEPVE